jgi:hypothetical protein
MSVLITSAPATGAPGSIITIQGVSSCGSTGTTFSASANGAAVAIDSVDWTSNENWSAKVTMPPCDPDWSNVLVFKVACPPDVESVDVEISPCP